MREGKHLRPALLARSGLVAAWSWAARPGQDIASCLALSLGGDTMQMVPLGLSIAWVPTAREVPTHPCRGGLELSCSLSSVV